MRAHIHTHKQLVRSQNQQHSALPRRKHRLPRTKDAVTDSVHQGAAARQKIVEELQSHDSPPCLHNSKTGKEHVWFVALHNWRYWNRKSRSNKEGENELVLVGLCERSTVFDPMLACVTMVLTWEIPHAPYPVDPGTMLTAHISDLPPKYVTNGGGVGWWGSTAAGPKSPFWCTLSQHA